MGRLGHRVGVFERWPDLYPRPRAVHYDDEVARIFQRLGIASELEPITEPATTYEWQNADGRTLLRLDRSEPGPSGWPGATMFFQPQLEQLLDRTARAVDSVEVHQGWELTGLRDEGPHVTPARAPRRRPRPAMAPERRGARGHGRLRDRVRRRQQPRARAHRHAGRGPRIRVRLADRRHRPERPGAAGRGQPAAVRPGTADDARLGGTGAPALGVDAVAGRDRRAGRRAAVRVGPARPLRGRTRRGHTRAAHRLHVPRPLGGALAGGPGAARRGRRPSDAAVRRAGHVLGDPRRPDPVLAPGPGAEGPCRRVHARRLHERALRAPPARDRDVGRAGEGDLHQRPGRGCRPRRGAARGAADPAAPPPEPPPANLGPGIHDGAADAGGGGTAGSLFPQGRVETAAGPRLLEDTIPPGFVLYTLDVDPHSLLADEDSRAYLQSLRVRAGRARRERARASRSTPPGSPATIASRRSCARTSTSSERPPRPSRHKRSWTACGPPSANPTIARRGSHHDRRHHHQTEVPPLQPQDDPAAGADRLVLAGRRHGGHLPGRHRRVADQRRRQPPHRAARLPGLRRRPRQGHPHGDAPQRLRVRQLRGAQRQLPAPARAGDRARGVHRPRDDAVLLLQGPRRQPRRAAGGRVRRLGRLTGVDAHELRLPRQPDRRVRGARPDRRRGGRAGRPSRTSTRRAMAGELSPEVPFEIPGQD